jgi:anti-sigma factor RsiW
MEREKLETLLIDYIDGTLTEADRLVVERELETNEASRKLYEQLKEVIMAMEDAPGIQPSSSLKNSFDNMLSNEIASANKSKQVFLTPNFWRVAASVLLLVVGGGVGYWVSKYQRQQEDIRELQAQLNATKDRMMSMMGNDLSASQRLQGVNVALTIKKADDDVVNALVKALNEDPNTNVRLAALEALSNFKHETSVRKELIQSLAKQKDPIVQINLIQLMVQMKEKKVVDDLQRIIDDEQTIKPVKDEAYSGILKLS